MYVRAERGGGKIGWHITFVFVKKKLTQKI
jgi:hypothetical protein